MSISNICTSNLTSGFIDLATYDELEKYMYGGADATAYFVREHRKSTWFTQVPVVLSRSSGTPDFNTEWSVSISRAGDYLLYTWLRAGLPAVTLSSISTGYIVRPRWTQNVGHNLIKECCITFNDLVAARFDHYQLDFWNAFTLPASKKTGYNNMIGNVPALTQEGVFVEGSQASLPAYTLNVPLPFFYSRDSGVALPTAALPYNEMRINFSLRDWRDLLVVDVYYAQDEFPRWKSYCINQLPTNIAQAPSNLVLQNPCVFANYAIVSNDERKRMACAPRDILIEQVQTAPIQNFLSSSTNDQPQFDIRFSHAIKALFFAVRNKTVSCDWSNYSTVQSYYNIGGVGSQLILNGGIDPLQDASLIYENTYRLQMYIDYYSLVNPYYHAPTIPDITGYHAYSYSLDFFCLDPKGSTNYGKLTNVSIVPHAAQESVALAGASTIGPYTDAIGSSAAANWLGANANLAYGPQQYSFITTVVNNNIIRISGGALGFPVL